MFLFSVSQFAVEMKKNGAADDDEVRTEVTKSSCRDTSNIELN